MTTADKLIEAIKVNAPNLYHIAETGKINGSLHADLKSTIESLLEQVKQLEAERAEVRNKVIEEMTIKLDERLSEHVQHEGDYIAVRISELQEITNLLNSLKTK